MHEIIVRFKLKNLIIIIFIHLLLSQTCIEGDCLDGYGKYIYEDGSIYKGYFYNGVKEGQGEFVFLDGRNYQECPSGKVG